MYNKFELRNYNLNPNDFGFSSDGKTWTLLLRPPWELEELSVEDEFSKVWRELTFGKNIPENLKEAGEMLCGALRLWRAIAVPQEMVGIVLGTPHYFRRPSRAYDTEIINVVLDHPYIFDDMKAYCIDKGLDWMIDAYFAGVPLDDIIAE